MAFCDYRFSTSTSVFLLSHLFFFLFRHFVWFWYSRSLFRRNVSMLMQALKCRLQNVSYSKRQQRQRVGKKNVLLLVCVGVCEDFHIQLSAAFLWESENVSFNLSFDSVRKRWQHRAPQMQPMLVWICAKGALLRSHYGIPKWDGKQHTSEKSKATHNMIFF